jgi:hypothetical protein
MLNPVLSSLTELITGAVTEDFKKLFKPSALVAAGIFLALNLVVILPPLREVGFGPVVALERLSTAWQAALGTLLLFALAYVINSLGGPFLSLASGTAFRDSPIVGNLLLWLQRRTYDRLRKTARSGRTRQEKVLAIQRLAVEFPSEGSVEFTRKNALAPTRLGNVLASTSAYTWNKYGAHLGTLWPYMDIVLKQEDSGLRDQLNENRDALTFLATLSGVLSLVAIELAVVYLRVEPWKSLWALAILAVAYAVYNAAVQKGKAWGSDVRTAFELYLDKVAERLDLQVQEKTKWEEAKERWEGVSRWLAYGGMDLTWHKGKSLAQLVAPEASWYKEPAGADQAQLHHPDTVTVERGIEAVEMCTQRVGTSQTWHYAQVADYLYTITNEETGEHARVADAVYLLVSDSRLLSVPKQKIMGDLTVPAPYGVPQEPPIVTIIAKKLRSDKPYSLLWYIGRVAPRSGRALQYTITNVKAKIEIRVDSGFEVQDVSQPSAKCLLIMIKKSNAGQGKLTVDIDLPYGEQLSGAEVMDRVKGEGKLAKTTQQGTLCQVEFDIPSADLFDLSIWWK